MTEHAVLVDVGRHRARGVAQFVLAGLDGPVDAAPGADDLLDVSRRTCSAGVDERLLRVRRGDSAERPDQGVGGLAVLHRVAAQGRFGEGSGDLRPRAGGAGRESDSPVEPVRAACEAVRPAFLFVERANQDEQLVGRRIDAHGKRGDPFAQPLLGRQVGKVCVCQPCLPVLGAGGCDRRRGFGHLAGAPDDKA